MHRYLPEGAFCLWVVSDHSGRWGSIRDHCFQPVKYKMNKYLDMEKMPEIHMGAVFCGAQ